MAEKEISKENNKEISKEFQEQVQLWVKIDDSLRDFKNKSRELTQEKKEIEEYILSYLDEIGEKSIGITNGNLRKNISKSKAPLKKENIYNTIKDLTKDEVKASTITNQIFENRPLTERVNLKRTNNKNKKAEEL